MPMLSEKSVTESKPRERPWVRWDSQLRGFGLRIHPTGSKVFILNYRIDGRERRATIGRPAELTVKAARKAAAAMLADIRLNGADPLAKREERRSAPTIGDLLDRYFDEFAPERVRMGRLSPRTIQEYRLQASKHIRPALGGIRVGEIARADIEAMLHGLPPATLNRVHSFIRRLLNLAEQWELRPLHSNPAVRIDRSREEPRDRVLTADELAALAKALNAMQADYPAPVAAIRIAALSGLRIGEVLAVEWEHVDFASGRLTMPQTKTGRRSHDLPAVALEILSELPRLNRYVFTSGNAPESAVVYKTVRRHFADACERAGLDDVRLHDLRRTAISRAAEAGISAHILRDFLGHKSAIQADKYIRQLGAPVRDAREQIGSQLAAEMAGKTADVVNLRR